MILLRPAIALMQRLRLLPKFALVSLVFLLPLLLASGLLVAELQKSVSFTVQERQGLAYIRQLHELRRHLQEKRNLEHLRLAANQQRRKRHHRRRPGRERRAGRAAAARRRSARRAAGPGRPGTGLAAAAAAPGQPRCARQLRRAQQTDRASRCPCRRRGRPRPPVARPGSTQRLPGSSLSQDPAGPGRKPVGDYRPRRRLYRQRPV